MRGAAIVAYGAVSALGVGERAFTVGEPGDAPRLGLGTRAGGKPFGRATGVNAERAARPRALVELALAQLVARLHEWDPSFRARRIGVLVGTSSGGMAALERGQLRDGAYFAPLEGVSAVLGREPERLVALYGACASSALALGLGLRWLQLGRCDLVIAGGYDAESDWVAAGFDALKATSASTPLPFRSERDGMALGEGAALVALAVSGSSHFGFLRGFGATSDAVHITAPDRTGQSLARAARLALLDAQVDATEVDFVSVHGTGTSFNDAAEARALLQVLGPRAEQVPLHLLKPCVGHTLGAAGALEVLSACSALAQGLLPASPGAGTPLPELNARLLARNTKGKSELCLKLSTAFGGANAALVLAKRAATATTPRARRVVRVVAAGRLVTELDPARVAELLVAPPERLPRSDTLSCLAVAAVAEALYDARSRSLALSGESTGVIVGSVGATLEADREFAARIVARGPAHAEPRRFPATSPNAGAGHVAIAFGFRGVAHAVGAGPAAALEAVEVAADWLEAGDAETLFVVAAEHSGSLTTEALSARGLVPPAQGALALVLSTSAPGPELDRALVAERRAQGGLVSGNRGPFAALAELAVAAGLPSPDAFGTVRAPE